MNRVRYLSLAALLLIAPAGPVLADSTEPLEQLVVEMAETSEQHLALANYYRQKAKISQEEAGRHRSMAAAYVAGKFRSRGHLDDQMLAPKVTEATPAGTISLRKGPKT